MTNNRLDPYHFYEHEWEGYDELREEFEFRIPETFDMATHACDRWATDEDRIAVFAEGPEGERREFTFDRIKALAEGLAATLRGRGIAAGDRIGVFLPSKPETLVSHVASWKLGAVSVPLSTLFGPDAVAYRLADCEARACIVDESTADSLFGTLEDLEQLELVIVVGDASGQTGAVSYGEAVERDSSEFEPASVGADDEAMIIYTSGTTGDPKGVVHAHRFLLGNLPGYVMGFCNMQVEEGDVNWHIAEWSWVSSLFLGLFCPLFYGNPVVAIEDGKFDPERTFEVIEEYDVVNFFAPPTGLRMMMQVDPPDPHAVQTVRTVSSGGEAVGTSIVDWAKEVFGGAAVHEMYGQTEAHTGVTDCTALYPFHEGTLGRPVVGADVRIVDKATAEPTVEPGEVGEFAIRADHPACFVEYWNNADATAEKVVGGWLLYEDLGTYDEECYFTFVSRKDDVIISAGYRIGPTEIEETLTRHEAVADAGVIGVPDEIRGEVPKAFVQLAERHDASGALVDDLQQHVRDRLAKYEYPREIEFVDELPKTTTGKVRRATLREEASR